MTRRKLHILKKTKSISFLVSEWKREKKKIKIHTNSSLAFTAPWWFITHFDHDSLSSFILSDSQATTPCFNYLIMAILHCPIKGLHFELWSIVWLTYFIIFYELCSNGIIKKRAQKLLKRRKWGNHMRPEGWNDSNLSSNPKMMTLVFWIVLFIFFY